MSHQQAESTKVTCNACLKPLPEPPAEAVKCYQCESEYHFSPCAGITEKAYAVMTKNKRLEWRCTSCKMQTRTGTPNIIKTITPTITKPLAPTMTIADNNHDATKKRVREIEDDGDNMQSGNTKQQKNNITNQNSNTNMILTTDIKDIKQIIIDMNTRLSTENKEIKEEMSKTYTGLHDIINKLTNQINELRDKTKEQDEKINKLENKLKDIEQQNILNNIEISNVPIEENENILTTINKLATTLDIQLTEADITDAYRDKKKTT